MYFVRFFYSLLSLFLFRVHTQNELVWSVKKTWVGYIENLGHINHLQFEQRYDTQSH